MISLYGVAVDLPEGVVDTSALVFTSKIGPVRKLVFSREALSNQEAALWLEGARQKLAAAEDAQVGSLEVFANPRFLLRGFKASFGKDPSARGTRVIATLSRSDGTIVLQFKCEPGFEATVDDVLRTLRTDGVTPSESYLGGKPAVGHCYRAFDLSFDSSQELTPPGSFSFSSPSGDVRIWCRRGQPSPLSTSPAWSERFGLGPEVTLTVIPEPLRLTGGRGSFPGASDTLAFHDQRWLATADSCGALRPLVYAEALTALGDVNFHLVLAAERDAASALDLWSSLLSSARRE